MPPIDSSLQLEPFFEQLSSWRSGALALDYDGTLAPFHVDRDAAIPYPGVGSLIQAIQATDRTRVVLISGRPAEEVRHLLGIAPAPEIWGAHGRQRLWPNGRCEMAAIPPAHSAALQQADAWLEVHHLRGLAECKPGSIALHWRGLPPEEIAQLASSARAAFAPIAVAGRMSLLEFDGGIELRPSEPNKGSAVRTLLGELQPGTPLAYLGDDTTDEDAFLALRDSGALTVLVRPEWRQTAARAWIRPPQELIDFLRAWLRHSGGDA